MKKYFVIPITVIAIIILLGFIIAVFLPSEDMSCTAMACSCEGVEGERPCNSCGFSKPIFTTGLLNVVQVCSAKEIIVCKNNKEVDNRIDLENKICQYDWYILTFNY